MSVETELQTLKIFNDAMMILLLLGLDMTVIGCLCSGAMLVSWCHDSTHASVAPLQQCVACFSQQLQLSVKVTSTNQHSLPLTNAKSCKIVAKNNKNMTFESFFVSKLSNLAMNIKLQNLQIKLHSVVIVTMLILTMKIFDVVLDFSWRKLHIVEETTSAENCLDLAQSCEIIPQGLVIKPINANKKSYLPVSSIGLSQSWTE